MNDGTKLVVQMALVAVFITIVLGIVSLSWSGIAAAEATSLPRALLSWEFT